jgi:hypothetical protein
MTTSTAHELEQRLAEMEVRLAAAELTATRAQDRGDVENVFSRYMHYHNAFEDERIVDELWVRGTEGVRSQYNNDGVYTEWDTIMAYHRGRPHPVGKLILHYTTTPVIEVAANGTTAKGPWLMAGIESDITEPAEAAHVPGFFFTPREVEGRKIWAHWVWCKYGIDFVKQDGQWRIWRFRCYELARAPFDEDWISFAAHERAEYEAKLMYFGEDGAPVFMPPVDGPTVTTASPYRIGGRQELVPEPPQPYARFEDTFR